MWLAMAGCKGDVPAGTRSVVVEREDLVLDVMVAGTLRSLDYESVGPSPLVSELWNFKILRMVSEGTRVKEGDELVVFDPSDLEKKLRDAESVVAEYVEELGKLRSEGSLDKLSDRLALVEAEARQRKAEIKADKPADLTAQQSLRVSGIDRSLAEREVQYQKEREQAKRQRESSSVAILESRLRQARSRVADFQQQIAAMTVRAKRGGTVIYRQNRRGEKRKVGDSLWRVESVLEIASLDRMAALGQVDEVDASHIRVGQRVGLRLEAHPDREYAGIVEKVAALVGTESPDSRNKVLGLDIKLVETDPMLMRPGMRFRGRIEIERLSQVVQLPLPAIESTPAGPTVHKVTRGGSPQRTAVTLGRRGREAVEVLSGVAVGDRVLLHSSDGAKGGRKAAGKRGPGMGGS